MKNGISRLAAALATLATFMTLAGCACAHRATSPSAGSAVAAASPVRRVIATDKAPQALASYSQAIEAGNTLYLAGQIGLDPATRELVPGGIEAEVRRALENCKAILEVAGYTLHDVVQMQVLLADIGDYQALNQIYAVYFSREPPARAAFAVAALPRGARVEIVMTAVRVARPN